jgi:hypothetical protein
MKQRGREKSVNWNVHLDYIPPRVFYIHSLDILVKDEVFASRAS